MDSRTTPLEVAAWAKLPSPRYMPTCEMPGPDVLKNTRSPALRLPLGTFLAAAACLEALLGISTPTDLNTAWVKPEQSVPFLVAPP